MPNPGGCRCYGVHRELPSFASATGIPTQHLQLFDPDEPIR